MDGEPIGRALEAAAISVAKPEASMLWGAATGIGGAEGGNVKCCVPEFFENVAGHVPVGGTFSVINIGTGGGLAISSIVGGTASVLGGGKFGNGALTGAFGYLFNACGDGGCWTTSDERAILNTGDFLGYYSKACEGGDLNACFFYGVASGENPGPGVTLRQGLMANGYPIDQAYSLVKTTIPLDLANDYANLLPQSEDQAAFPSAQSIADYHWSEFSRFGLPPSTFGGTPFGKSFGLVLPHLWCPLCKP